MHDSTNLRGWSRGAKNARNTRGSWPNFFRFICNSEARSLNKMRIPDLSKSVRAMPVLSVQRDLKGHTFSSCWKSGGHSID